MEITSSVRVPLLKVSTTGKNARPSHLVAQLPLVPHRNGVEAVPDPTTVANRRAKINNNRHVLLPKHHVGR